MTSPSRNVCVGPEFEVDDAGNLTVAICGDPVDSSFCTGGVNALQRDPECGLYVNQALVSERRFNSGEQQQGNPGLLAAPNQKIDQVSFTVANPSECCGAIVTLFVNHYVTIGMGTGTAALIASVTSRTIGQPNEAALFIENEVGPDFTERVKVTDAVTFILPAGATNTVYTSVLVRARRTAGTERVRFSSVEHDVFGTIASGNCVGPVAP